jgi:hypothetical protein
LFTARLQRVGRQWDYEFQLTSISPGKSRIGGLGVDTGVGAGVGVVSALTANGSRLPKARAVTKIHFAKLALSDFLLVCFCMNIFLS